MSARATALAAWLVCLGTGAGAAVVDIREDAPRTYTVRGAFDVDASTAAAWSVLSDYDALPRFVPDLKASRVRYRGPRAILLEQEARARFWLFSRDVHVTLRVTETPGERINFQDVALKDFTVYRGTWTILPSALGAEVRYDLTAEPKGSAPSLIAKRAMRGSARELLDRVRREIMRRQAVENARLPIK